MIHNSDKQRYDRAHDMKKKKQNKTKQNKKNTHTHTQHSEADKILFWVSTYESFKSKLTPNSPVNPLSVHGRLWECKNPEFVWELKRGFVIAIVSRTIHYIRECPLRELPLYEFANDSLNEK